METVLEIGNFDELLKPFKTSNYSFIYWRGQAFYLVFSFSFLNKHCVIFVFL